jgi:hypothetical protein
MNTLRFVAAICKTDTARMPNHTQTHPRRTLAMQFYRMQKKTVKVSNLTWSGSLSYND